MLVAGAALVGLQLPWLALWLAGEGRAGSPSSRSTTLADRRARGVAAAGGARAVRRAGERPRPRSRGVYVRALRRRAGDALVRGAGLAVLAGVAGGLLVRNNQLAGARGRGARRAGDRDRARAGAGRALLPLVDAHRADARGSRASLGSRRADRARSCVAGHVIARRRTLLAAAIALRRSIAVRDRCECDRSSRPRSRRAIAAALGDHARGASVAAPPADAICGACGRGAIALRPISRRLAIGVLGAIGAVLALASRHRGRR